MKPISLNSHLLETFCSWKGVRDVKPQSSTDWRDKDHRSLNQDSKNSLIWGVNVCDLMFKVCVTHLVMVSWSFPCVYINNMQRALSWSPATVWTVTCWLAAGSHTHLHRAWNAHVWLQTRRGFRAVTCSHVGLNPSSCLLAWGAKEGAPQKSVWLIQGQEQKKPEWRLKLISVCYCSLRELVQLDQPISCRNKNSN